MKVRVGFRVRGRVDKAWLSDGCQMGIRWMSDGVRGRVDKSVQVFRTLPASAEVISVRVGVPNATSIC